MSSEPQIRDTNNSAWCKAVSSEKTNEPFAAVILRGFEEVSPADLLDRSAPQGFLRVVIPSSFTILSGRLELSGHT